jgi:DNA-directed RNA polymerase subunit H
MLGSRVRIPHGPLISQEESTMPKKTTKKLSFDVTTHILVPEHKLLNDKQRKALFEKYHVAVSELPKIFVSDSAISDLNAQPGDVIKIIKKSRTAGETVYYRGVINE